MAKSSIDIAVVDVFQELAGADAFECYLAKVDLLCTPGTFKPTAASELEGVLNDAFCDYISGKLTIDELDELKQYIRAYGFVAIEHANTTCGFSVEWPGYAEYATGGLLPANFEKLIKKAQTSPFVPKFPDGGLCK